MADWSKLWSEALSRASGGSDAAAGCSVMMLLVNNSNCRDCSQSSSVLLANLYECFLPVHNTCSFSPLSAPQYMKDVNCPFKVQERQETVDWLLGLAVRLEYGDNGMMNSSSISRWWGSLVGYSMLWSVCKIKTMSKVYIAFFF